MEPDPAPPARTAVLFGATADPDERTAAVRSKLSWIDGGRGGVDIVRAVAAAVQAARPGGHDAVRVAEAAARDVTAGAGTDGWLSPTPDPEHRGLMTEEAFARFVDDDGCRRLAEAVEGFVDREVLPAVPVMVGVDHSLTGGVLRSLARLHDSCDLAVVVLDSHTDAVPTEATAGAVHYDMETNPRSVYDAGDPLLSGRSDSYNASTFLHHLVEEGVVDPRNLYLVGVADTPPSRARKIDDPRIRRYVRTFADLRRQGVTVVTHEEVAANPARVGWELARSQAAHVYVSIDLDLGANRATKAVRFRDRDGIDASTIARVVDEIALRLSDTRRLVGVDVMEFDVRALRPPEDPSSDPLVMLAGRLISSLVGTLDA